MLYTAYKQNGMASKPFRLLPIVKIRNFQAFYTSPHYSFLTKDFNKRFDVNTLVLISIKTIQQLNSNLAMMILIYIHI